MADRLRISASTLDSYQDALELATRRWTAEAEPYVTKLNAYFRGNQWPVGESRDSPTMPRLVANLIYADVKTMLPVLALRYPRIFVKPVGNVQQAPYQTQDGQTVMRAVEILNGQPFPVLDAAQAKEALANWRWRQLRLNAQVRRVITDALLGPWGIMKLGYTAESEKLEAPSPSAAQDGDQGSEIQVTDVIKAETPYGVRWDPRLVRVDPEARYPSLEDAAWIAFGSYERPEDLKRNPRYRNTRGLKASVPMKLDYGTTPHGDYAVPSELYRCLKWEIWDKRERMLVTVVDDWDAVLEYRPWPITLDGFPAETLCFTEYPDQLYGPPDLWHVLSQQDVYNEVVSMSVNHIHRFLRKWVVQRGAFQETELLKLMQPIDGLVVEAEAPVNAAIGAVPDAPIPVDWYQVGQRTLNDHDRVSGIADFIRGQAEKVDTATEAAYIQSALTVRTNDTKALVEGFAARITKTLLAIDAQTMDLPKAIPVIGPDGVVALGEYIHIASPEYLQCECDVEVEVGSMQPINQQVRKQDILQVFGMLRGDPLADQFELRRRLLPAFQDSIPDLDRVLLSPEQYQQLHQAMLMSPPPPKVAVNLKGMLDPEWSAHLAGEPPPAPPNGGMPPGGPPGGPPGAPAGPPPPGGPPGPLPRPPSAPLRPGPRPPVRPVTG